MHTMLESMRKAGLVSEEKAEKVRKKLHAEKMRTIRKTHQSNWEQRAMRNQYGAIAMFEVWNHDGRPHDYRKFCAICGKAKKHMVPCTIFKVGYSICRSCSNAFHIETKEPPSE